MEVANMHFFIAVAVLILSPSVTGSPDDSPFTPGTLKIDTMRFSPGQDGSPLYTTMYYPTKPGSYPPLIFLGGFYDVMGTKFYHTFLNEIAQHGYMVFGIDMFPWKGEANHKDVKLLRRPLTVLESHVYHEVENPIGLPDFFKQMTWLENNVTNRTTSRPLWRNLTLSCHSASCSTILGIVHQHPTFAEAAAFLDPVCINALYLKPEKVRTKVLAFTTSKSFEFPDCCVKGLSYKKVYDLLETIKIRMAIRNFGHCGILDKFQWRACNLTGICHTGDGANLPEYKRVTAGLVHAFIQYTLFEQKSMLQYLTEESKIPLALDDLAYDLQRHPEALDQHLDGR